MANLVHEVGRGDFWTRPRHVQVVRMVARRKVHRVTQKDIAFVLRVTAALVSKYKLRFEETGVETRNGPGRKSQLSDVLPDITNFIRDEMLAGRSVTMSVLMDFLVDKVRTPIARSTLWTFMGRKGSPTHTDPDRGRASHRLRHPRRDLLRPLPPHHAQRGSSVPHLQRGRDGGGGVC